MNPVVPMLLATVGLLCTNSAIAALGGAIASVTADAADLHGVDRITALDRYVIHEISADNGLRVREFLNQDGQVFAVSWSGPVMPDLRELLGPHFLSYSSALAGVPQRALRRTLRIVADGVVVETGGHMRNITGRAYLPGRVPAGASLPDLR